MNNTNWYVLTKKDRTYWIIKSVDGVKTHEATFNTYNSCIGYFNENKIWDWKIRNQYPINPTI